MAGHSSVMIGWNWTEVSVLDSQVFGQALMKCCAVVTWPQRFQGQLRHLSSFPSVL